MSFRARTRSEVVDELIINPRRLAIAHATLGLASAALLWMLPGTFTPGLPGGLGLSRTPSILIVIDTSIAWAPYVISWAFSRWLLSGRDPKATAVFIVCASVVALGSTALYLGFSGFGQVVSRFAIALCVTLALITIAGVCSLVWPSDVQ